MFTNAEKTLSVCCIKTREREKGGEREKETDLKLKKTPFQSHWTPCRTCSQHVAYSQINRHSCMIKVWFASGAKNKFAAFPCRDQTRISFEVSWEKFLRWNFLPFFWYWAFGGEHGIVFWRSFMRSLLRLGHFLPAEVSFGCVQNLCLRQNQRRYCKTWCVRIISRHTYPLNTTSVSKIGSHQKRGPNHACCYRVAKTKSFA